MRCFIALPCPDEVRRRLAAAQKQIAGFGGLKLVEEENIHLTLKFLDEIDEHKAQQVLEEMLFMESFGRFAVNVKGLGAFPNTNRINVVWAGLEDGREVVRLHDELDNRLSSLGFAKDRNFHPHYTLARVKSPLNIQALEKYLNENKDPTFGSYTVDSALLMASRLTNSGPIYSIMGERRVT